MDGDRAQSESARHLGTRGWGSGEGWGVAEEGEQAEGKYGAGEILCEQF